MTAAPGRRELTKSQNRQAILVAARQVFADLGFGAATVRDIIRATPLASGTFYNYFKSKEEVYQAIRDEVALTIAPRLQEERANAATVEEFLAASFGAFFEFVIAQQGEVRSDRPGANRLRLDTPEVVAGFGALRTDLESAMARGLFPNIDPHFLSAAMAGVAFEISEQMLRRECGAAPATAFATALFLGGIKALAPPD